MRVKIEYGDGIPVNTAAEFFKGLGVEGATVTYGRSYPVYGNVDAATLDRLRNTLGVTSVTIVSDDEEPDDLVVGGA